MRRTSKLFLSVVTAGMAAVVLLAASPMVWLRPLTCFGFASMLVVFVIWALCTQLSHDELA